MVLSTSAVLSSSTENIKRFSLNHIHNLPPSPFRLYSAVRRLLSRLVTYPLAAPAQSKSSRPPKLFSMSISELEPEETQRRTLRAGDLEKYESEHFLDDNDVATENEDDPNFDPRAEILEDESPYPEVRSAVANTDDPTMPASTLRAWLIGIVWAVLIPGINQFFFFRYPSVYISSVCAP
jgi:hypothetical protein